MIGASRLQFLSLLCALLMSPRLAPADAPKDADAKAIAARNAMKVPTRIAGTYRGGKLIELRVHDRIACAARPVTPGRSPARDEGRGGSSASKSEGACHICSRIS